MKTKEAFGITVRLVSLMAGLIVAIIGAYLLLSGAVLLCDQKFLPGTLDMLVGFLLVRAGRHVIPLRILSHDA